MNGDIEIRITDAIDGDHPTDLANYGEQFGYEANGLEGNPSPEAWMRAGIAVGLIMRTVRRGGRISVPLLVAIIADTCDPAHDGTTPQRRALINNHRSAVAPPEPTP